MPSGRTPGPRKSYFGGLAVVETPGSLGGPCVEDTCAHTVCLLEHAIARAACVDCREPIGYARGYTTNAAGDRQHDACGPRREEKLRQTRRAPVSLGPRLTRELAVPEPLDDDGDDVADHVPLLIGGAEDDA